MAARSRVPLARAVDNQLYIIGMTRAELAERMEISGCYLSYLLNCRQRPSIEMTNRMAEIINMEASELRRLVLRAAV